MATSGTIKSNVMDGGYYLAVLWEVTSQSETANTSTVKLTVRLGSNDSSHNINSSASKTVKLTADGTTYEGTGTIGNLPGNGTVDLYTKSVTVKHGSDGKKTLSLAASVVAGLTISGTYYGTISTSGSAALPAIARSSQPDAVSGNMGSELTITTNRASSSFTHTITYKFGSKTGTIGTGVGASCKWTPAIADFAPEVPNAVSGTGTITCKTYSGSTLIGTTTATLTLKVPSSVKPTGSIATSDAKGLLDSLGAYVKGYSKLKVKTTASGAHGSTVKTISAEINGTTKTGADVTFDAFNKSGDLSLTVTVTDSRGRTLTLTKAIAVANYAAPSLSNVDVQRINEQGQPDDGGTRARITFAYAASAVGSSNRITAKVRYKRLTDAAYTEQNVFTAQATLAGTSTTYVGTISADDAYEVLVDLSDLVTSSTASVAIESEFQLMNFAANGRAVAFGGVAQRALGAEFKMPAFFDAGAELDGFGLGSYANDGAATGSATNYFRIGRLLIQMARVIVPGGSGSLTNLAFEWPVAFAAKPYVASTLESTVPGTQITGYGVANVTASGGTAYVLRNNSTSTPVDIVGIGLAPV